MKEVGDVKAEEDGFEQHWEFLLLYLDKEYVLEGWNSEFCAET